MRFKMTKEEKNWVLYDVGNSAFVLLVSTIMPIYFNYLSEKAGLSSVDYLAFWGYAASIVTIIVAFLGPVLGTVADTKGYKKPIFIITLLIGDIKNNITKIISLEKSGEYFGLMDVCGKGASFLGTTVVGVLSQTTGQINLSLGALSIFFMLGIVFFRMSEKREG